MQALLLAGGLGTRLQPLTNYIPKCLAPIRGYPLLGIWLEQLVNAGCEKIYINLHYMPGLVRQFVEESGYKQWVEFFDEPKLLGTAGTLIKNRQHFSPGPLLLIHADNLSVFSISSLWEYHKNANASIDITMMTFCTDDPSSCGIVELTDNGQVSGFYEKVKFPPGNTANAAALTPASFNK